MVEERENESAKEIVELGDLSEELVEEILCRVPIKCRTRLKSVSKNWRNFIGRLRQSSPLTTSSGLVIFLKGIHKNPILHSSNFIQIRDQTLAQNAALHSSFLHNFPWLVDSCNGLLLYGTDDNEFWTYHVSGPFLKHPIALPRAHQVSRSASASLIFDGSSYDQFRVICFFRDEVDFAAKTVKYMVFSSKNWEWREYEARILNSDLMQEDGFVPGHCFRPSVYCRRKLFWIWSFCLLIYDDEIEFFKLIRLPSGKNLKNNVYLSQLLWESEGRIHFCSPVNEGFCLWAYVDDDDEGHEFMDCNLMWQFKRLVVLDELISGKIEFFYAVNEMIKYRMGWSRKRIQPVAFNEDLQLLYLQVMPGIIVSYSFETQRLERVWFREPGDNYCMCNIFPFLFNSRN